MAQTAIDILKGWFSTGKKPTGAQFTNWLDSYYHKDDVIPLNKVDGLQDALNSIGGGSGYTITETRSADFTRLMLAGSLVQAILVVPLTVDDNPTIQIGTTPGGSEIMLGSLCRYDQPEAIVLNKYIRNDETWYISGINSNSTIKFLFR